MTNISRCYRIYGGLRHGFYESEVSIDISILPGLPQFEIVGIPDYAGKELKGIIAASIKVSSYKFPQGHIIVSVEDGKNKDEYSNLGLPIALGIIILTEQVRVDNIIKIFADGNLHINGEVSEVKGSTVRLKASNSYDRRIVAGDEIYALSINKQEGVFVSSLSDAINSLTNYSPRIYDESSIRDFFVLNNNECLDFSVVRGQEKAKRAILIAASGWHNLLLLGSPGCGKSLCARLISSLLPPLNMDEIIELVIIEDCLGETKCLNEISISRPSRIITPDMSSSRIWGNRSNPGEIIRSSNGIFLIEELMDFRSTEIDKIRLLLEDSTITSNNHYSLKDKTNMLFVGTGNPCRCGFLYEENRRCTCSSGVRKQYMSKLSVPFLDRIDLVSEMISISDEDKAKTLVRDDTNESLTIKEIVSTSWEIQHERYKGNYLNGNVDFVPEDLLRAPKEVINLALELTGSDLTTARSFNKIVRVGRTIADLEQREDMNRSDIYEAMIYRYRSDS